MLKNNIKNDKFIPWAIFIFFFCVTLSIHSLSPYFSMPDDPYYHARESASMLTGEKNVPPAFSTLSDKPVDLYYLYHLTMAPFTYFFKGNNYEALIVGVKIYQSFLVAFLFSIFYLILRGILRKKIPDKGERTIIMQSLLGTLLLFTISSSFAFRMIMERPAIFNIVAMLGIFYFIVNKRWPLVFLIAMILPFFYSASFLLLIPGFIFLLTYFFSPEISTKEKWKPLVIIIAGLAVGIILRPDSLAYLYNGYLVPIFAIGYAIFFRIHSLLFPNGLYIADELQSGGNSYESWKSVFFIISLAVVYRYLTLKEFKNKISTQDFFLFFMSFILVTGSLVIVRLIEYALPFAVLFCFSTQDTWINYFTYLPSKIKEYKNKIFCGIAIFLLLLIFTQINYVILIMTSSPFLNNYQNYEGASLYLKEHIKPKAVVYLVSIESFNQLFFYNPMISYSSGMDTMFQKLHDYPLYQKTSAFDNGETSADFLKDLNVEYVLIDKRFPEDISLNGRKFFQNIEKDNNLVLLYQDPNHPYVLIYGFK